MCIGINTSFLLFFLIEKSFGNKVNKNNYYEYNVFKKKKDWKAIPRHYVWQYAIGRYRAKTKPKNEPWK